MSKDSAPCLDISKEHSEIIEMAWCDETSFDAIFSQTGLREKDVIEIMRTYMKPSSFRMWRKRVAGRATKHDKKTLRNNSEVIHEIRRMRVDRAET